MALPDPVLLPSGAHLWRTALEAMSPTASPCRYLPAPRWGEVRGKGLDFLDRFGAEAHALGWTAGELFGVHPEHGTLRVDWCGALIVSPVQATGIEAERVVFERTAAYRGRAGQPVGVPVWEFAARAGR